MKAFFSTPGVINKIVIGVLSALTLTLMIVFAGPIGRMIAPDLDLSGRLQADETGGELVFDLGDDVGDVTIDVPAGAYDETISFTVAAEPFEPVNPPALLNAVTPLIHVDNGDAPAAMPLAVSIPIAIDTTTEFAMAFYYDAETDTYDAIPTLSLADDEIVVATTHFSSIIVSKVMHSQLLEMVLMNPSQFDTGFRPGVDDFPFDNYGSEVAIGGHCAGQSLAMSWYYTERKLKYGDDDLYARFDNQTPDIWYDDMDAYRFASILQSKFDFDSDAFDYYFDLLEAADHERFFSFAYALHMTRRPQLFAIYTTKTNPTTQKMEVDNGHAILVYKLEFNVNRYELHLADPNFNGDASRFVTYDENNGFGTYFSGENAEDIANQKGITYTEFTHMGQSALVDYKTIASYYQQVLDGTIGDDIYKSVSYEYLDQDEFGNLSWRALPDDLTYQGFEVDGQLAANEIMIRATSNHTAYRITPIHNDTILTAIYTNTGTKVRVKIPLDPGANDVGLIHWYRHREKSVDPYTNEYNSYHAFSITLDPDSVPDIDIDQVRDDMPGHYVEIERSAGVDPSYPVVDITITTYEDTGGNPETSAILYDPVNHLALGAGRWSVSDTVPGYEPGTPVWWVAAELVEDEDLYVVDPVAGTLTMIFDDDEYVVYERQATTDWEYVYVHRVALVNTSGILYEHMYDTMPNPIHYDLEWKLDMLKPDGNSLQTEIRLHTSDPFVKLVVIDPRYDNPFSRQSPWGSVGYLFTVADGESFSLTIEVYTWGNGDWVLADTQTVPITVDFSEE